LESAEAEQPQVGLELDFDPLAVQEAMVAEVVELVAVEYLELDP